MCFAPWISITTAVIEFVLATIILVYFKKGTCRYFAAVFLYFLGFYQLTEFMLCVTSNFQFWGRAGFITYTFLPAIGLDSILTYLNHNKNRAIIYLIPALFSFFAIISKNFVLSGSCNKIFLTVKTALFGTVDGLNIIPGAIYGLYYAGFIVAGCLLALKAYLKERNKIKKQFLITYVIAVLVMAVPTFALIIVIPSFGVMFPSILCQFALLLAIAVLIGVRIEQRLEK